MSFFECFCGKVITRNHTCPKDFKYHFNDGKSGSNPSSMCIKCLELFKKSHKCSQRISYPNTILSLRDPEFIQTNMSYL